MSGLALITMLGVILYLSPLRGDTVAVVGVFASLSALIVAVLATTEIEILSAEEENPGVDMTSLEEGHADRTMSDAAEFLDLSYTDMYLGKTDEFRLDVYSSESQITLSSHYGPRRAHLVKRRPKKTQTRRFARGARIIRKEGKKGR